MAQCVFPWACAAILLGNFLTVLAAPPTALFIFGDSIADQGMNNIFRFSSAKANYKPNGIDYPNSVPTGRFCNGLLTSDFLCDHWNIARVLAYDDPAQTNESLLNGANYASAGAGILNDTGNLFGLRYRMSAQVELFREHTAKIVATVGDAEAARIVSGALVSIGIGNNDFVANYFLPISTRRAKFTLSEYQAILITEFRKQVTAIYEIGARNIVVAGLGPFGCLPNVRALQRKKYNGKCSDEYNQAAASYNALVVPLVEEFRQSFAGATVLYSNAYDLTIDIINNPSQYGFEVANQACCGRGGPYKGLIFCNRLDPVCPDRTKFVFWDPFHPTEAVNKVITQRVLFGSTSDISPINLSQLYP